MMCWRSTCSEYPPVKVMRRQQLLLALPCEQQLFDMQAEPQLHSTTVQLQWQHWQQWAASPGGAAATVCSTTLVELLNSA
jgi:hypothetical protein